MQQVIEAQSGQQSDDIMAIREREVAERIRERSDVFTIRQMASIHKMSIPYLRDFADRHGITFVGTDGSRTKRLSSAIIAREREHTSTVVARSITRKPVTSLDNEKITPELRERARRRDQESFNSFIERLRELSATLTREQTVKATGISPTFLRSLAYNHELVFVGDTSRTNHAITPATIKKLKSSLFRPNKNVKPTISRMIRSYVMTDIEDEI